MRCPKCESEEYQKNGKVKGKQRYKCKECGYNYRTKNYYKYYSDKEKKEALRYHNEGIGFRRIGRLLGMNYKSVINWEKKAAKQIQKIIKDTQVSQNVEILELDEMCTTLKKKSNKLWIWTAVERKTKEIKGFFVGSRETSSFEKLSNCISNINADFYASDGLEAYNLINPKKHLIGKKYTYTVERCNRLMRHYLARFSRKSYSVSQKLYMVVYSLYIWIFRNLIPFLTL